MKYKMCIGLCMVLLMGLTACESSSSSDTKPVDLPTYELTDTQKSALAELNNIKAF